MVQLYVGHMTQTGFLPNIVENGRNGPFKSEKQAKNGQNGPKCFFFGPQDLRETCFVPRQLTVC